MEFESTYTSSIGPRSASARSRSTSRQAPISGGGRVLKMVTEMGSQATYGISPALTETGVKSYLQAAEREKKEMQSLNERLGNYIDRVRALEERNRKLVADLEDLRGRWGHDTLETKGHFGTELTEARRRVDDESKRKAELDTKLQRLQDDLRDMRARNEDMYMANERDHERIANYTTMLADAESDAKMLRARLKQLMDEQTRYGKDNHELINLIEKTRDDLDAETLARIDYQNQVQTLMEELEFLRRIHDQEVKELQALVNTQPADTREFFKNELALAIRDIKEEYDTIHHQSKSDMESWYKLKVTEVQNAQNRMRNDSNFQREETNRLRVSINESRDKLGDLEDKNAALEQQVKELTHQLEDDMRQYETAINDRDSQLRKIRDECQMLVAELQTLLDTKQMLDTEIAIYRKMLEGEETRAGLKQMVHDVVKSHTLHNLEDTQTNRSVHGQQATRTTFQRSSKGNLAVAEVDTDAKFISVENTHRTKDENIGQWQLRRKLDGSKEIVYTFPRDTVIQPGQTVKVWARTKDAQHNPPYELIFEGDTSWGTATVAEVTLTDRNGEERATYTQRTSNI